MIDGSIDLFPRLRVMWPIAVWGLTVLCAVRQASILDLGEVTRGRAFPWPCPAPTAQGPGLGAVGTPRDGRGAKTTEVLMANSVVTCIDPRPDKVEIHPLPERLDPILTGDASALSPTSSAPEDAPTLDAPTLTFSTPLRRARPFRHQSVSPSSPAIRSGRQAAPAPEQVRIPHHSKKHCHNKCLTLAVQGAPSELVSAEFPVKQKQYREFFANRVCYGHHGLCKLLN